MADPLAPISRGRTGGLSFRLLGIPVTIHVSFLLVLGFLGLGLGDPLLIAAWVLVGGASVLLHELGHAVAARLAGFSPTVELAGLGGVTTYRGDRGRGWGLVITGAGPGIQILAGLLALPFVDGFGLSYGGDLVTFALSVWVVVSLVWGVLNLVPVLPLDGGQLLRNLVPGGPATRNRIAQAVSVAVAGAALAWALVAGQVFAAVLAGWFGFANLQPLMAGRRDGDQQPGPDAGSLLAEAQEQLAAGDRRGYTTAVRAIHAPGPRPIRAVAATTVVRGLLAAGRDADAYRAVADPRHDLLIDEVVAARALAAHPDHAGVKRVVLHSVVQHDHARARGIAALVAALHGDLGTADAVLARGPVAPKVVEAIDALRPEPSR